MADLVVASAGKDKKLSSWRKNGQSLGTIPIAGTDSGDNIEESILAISFSNKGSRYICSGGSGQVVRIWNLQRKRCIKWLSGLTNTITGDDGSVHLWDTTGRSPMALFSLSLSLSLSLNNIAVKTCNKFHLPSTGFLIIASVGLDKKLYTYDSGSRRHSAFISHEAPFSSLAFRDDGWTLAAGTSNGRVAVSSLCWQRSKPAIVNELSCTAETALLGGPAELSSLTSSSESVSSTLNLLSSQESPHKSHLGPLMRLHALRSTYNFKDDMKVFSPLVDVQPITPSLDKLWNDHEGAKKEHLLTEKKPLYLLFPSSRRFAFADGVSDHPIFDWKSSSMSQQDDTRSFTALGSTPSPSSKSEEASITLLEA
ncbi:hypothetical protein REPUB_Repub03eG0217900 [Reevesia pubescens]